MTLCTDWKRARSDEQIEQREAAILDAAGRLFDAFRFDEITFAMIGKEAKFTRSNLYRYFKTKEEVFLRLLSEDIIAWQIEASAFVRNETITQGNFVERWLPTVLANKRLLKLNEIVASVLEMNASDDALKAFKRTTYLRMQILIEDLVDRKLFKSADNAYKFLMTHIALVSGMYPKLNLPASHQKLMIELGMAPNEGFYEAVLTEGVQALYERYLD